MRDYKYQVGGSLTYDSPSYVVRSADTELYAALQAREFCYVLTSRQMGKSSLLVRMIHQLRDQGSQCVTLDMTRLGSENITPQQWYKGLVTELWDGFDLPIDLQTWWREVDGLSMPQRLSRFVDDLLFRHVSDNIVIFIDEIDSILSLDFPVDDFFAWIRFCYNQRVHQADYSRLTFGLFGVATPSDLIQDRHRTPFNIGKAIHLQGFQLEEAQPLVQGLGEHIRHPQAVLDAILSWTQGQPFLTQKLCYLVQTLSPNGDGLKAEDEVAWVDEVVRSHLIQDWQTQDEPEHLRTIRDRIDRNGQRTGRLLALYQKMLQTHPPDVVPVQDTPEETELLLSGLIIKRQGTLQVKNRIYTNVFNLDWVNTQLATLRPYSQAFDAWIQSSRQDESRLLGGQALQDALAWAKGKSLSNEDYQFLAISTERDQQQKQQTLELSRLTEVQKNARLQKMLLGAVSLLLLGAIGFSSVVWRQNRALALREVEALAATSDALRESEQNLAALVTAIKASRQLAPLSQTETPLSQEVNSALRRAVYKVAHYNTLSGHQADIRTAIFSPDGQMIATASVDGTARLWQLDGTLITTLSDHTAAVSVIAFSPDGQTLATASEDGTAKLWRRDGTLITTLEGHSSSVWGVNFSPDGKTLATASGDNTIKLWQYDGTLVNTINHQTRASYVVFSPDGRTLASSSDSSIKLWKTDGTLINSLRDQDSRTTKVAFSPNGRTLAAAGNDGTIRLWQDGTLITRFKAHQAATEGIAFSPNGQLLASASADKTVKLWHLDGTLKTTFEGHEALVYDVRFSVDGDSLLTGSVDKTVRLWKVNSPLTDIFNGQAEDLLSVVFSPDGEIIATSSRDATVKLWHRDQTLITTLRGHQAPVWKVVFSPNGNTLASVSEDSTVKLWRLDGTLIKTLTGHSGGTWGVAFSPDGKTLASSGGDNTVKLWQWDGTLIRTLEGHEAPVWSVVFSPDGQTLATASGDSTAKLWNQEGSAIATFDNDGTPLFNAAFSPDGQTIATGGSDGIVKLWRTDGMLLKTLVGHESAVFQIAFRPNGKTIATASVDSTVKLWSSEGTLITSLEKHRAGVNGVSISPDGKTLATRQQ